MALSLVKQYKCFGGWVKQFQHASNATQTQMTFSVFLPQEAEGVKVPAIYYLSGLTCTDENVMTKAGIQRAAAQHGVAIVAPDTSPRGADVPGEADSWDFGTGAGFYVDATTKEFSKNYNMYSYVTSELPDLIESNFNVIAGNRSVFGHSMGGHGAIITALKNPGMFKSCSAFAPICHPSECPWGVKAFTGYLGEDRKEWKKYDATHLIQKYSGPELDILCEQGTEDDFLKSKQLLPQDLVEAATKAKSVRLRMNMREGYDHSYYFISTFMEEHIAFHAAKLFAK